MVNNYKISMLNQVEKWKEISKETVFKKYSRNIEKVIFQLPNGKETDFYLRQDGEVVAILALTKDQRVILAKQFRPGPREILLEIPGGGVEEGETPEEAGARELLEETGYQGKIQLVTMALDCAYSTMKRYCLVATDCEKVAKPQNTETEIIEPILLDLKEFRALLRSGQMTDIEVGYLGLDFLGLL